MFPLQHLHSCAQPASPKLPVPHAPGALADVLPMVGTSVRSPFQELANTLWGLSCLQFYDERFVSALLDVMRPKLPSLQRREIR